MAYKISGSSTDNNRAHVIKNGEYIGYKDVTSGAYDLVFDAPDNANVMTTSEKSDGETTGFGGITAIPTVDSPNLILPSSGMTIKSIQTGSIAIGNIWGSATINAVDPSKTMLILGGASTVTTGSKPTAYSLSLTNATTVQFAGYGYTSSEARFTVLEFDSGIASLQRIVETTTISTVPHDFTISAVDSSRTIVNFLGAASNYYWMTNDAFRCWLTTPTNVRFTNQPGGACGALYTSIEVIEFE